MKDQNFTVRVPEPCHEDWNKMKPEEKGRFCSSCQKTVVDFSTKTDFEIKTIIEENRSGQMCGHFRKSQLDRPLNYTLDLNNLPKNISTTKAFAIALFLVFGSILFSCTNEKDKDVNIVGMMIEPPPIEKTTGEPMIIDSVQTKKLEETSVEGRMVIQNETFVNGGIGYYGQDPISDSIYEIKVIKDSIIPEDFTDTKRGLIDVTEEDIQQTKTDSASTKSATSIGENVITKNTNLSIYPNPSSGEFTIKYDVLKRADVLIEIYDMKGSHIKTVSDISAQHSGKYQLPVNLKDMPSGIYIISLINNGEKFTEKVIVQ